MTDNKETASASTPPPPLTEASAYPAQSATHASSSTDPLPAIAAQRKRPSVSIRSRSDYDVNVSRSQSKHNVQIERFEAYAQALRQRLADVEVFTRDQCSSSSQQVEQPPNDEMPVSHGFRQSTTLFNSAAPLAAWLVVRPKSVQDVMATIKFCSEHQLSPSARSGGFSTAGWSIQGDVVLDLRAMNKVGVLPDRTYRGKEAAQATMSPVKGRSAAGDDGQGGSVDEGALKRRRENDSAGTEEQYALPQTDSRESGAEADDETSNGDKSSSNRSQRTSEDGVVDGKAAAANSTGMQLDRSRESTAMRLVPSSGDRIDYVDSPSSHTPLSNDNGSSHPSRSSMSGSGGDAGSGSTTSTSVDADMREPRINETITPFPNADGGAESSTVSGNVEFEHERWKKHHRPPTHAHLSPNVSSRPASTNAAPSKRLVLPSSGGFVWTAGDEQSGPFGTTRPLLAADSDAIHAAEYRANGQQQPHPVEIVERENDQLHELTLDSAVRRTSPSGATPALSGISLGTSEANTADRFTLENDAQRASYGHQPWTGEGSSQYVKPGIHKDKYILVEFEPGVGVRDLDIYTDNVGRNGTQAPSDEATSGTASKGKGRAKDEEAIRFTQSGPQGLDFTLGNGVPYHVPLSAYPVGSTAMTIGGFGYLSRAYGLSLDNIVELDIVLADGRLKTLNEVVAKSGQDQEAADLWWAVRGAAPCFGIVTRIVAKAYPVPRVYAGSLIYPFNPITAPSLLRHWRDCLKGTGEQIPRELYSNLILTAGPPNESAEHVIVIQVCYLGSAQSEEIGHSFVQAITSWTGERVMLKDVTEKSFLSQQDGVAQVLKSGQGRRWMVRGDLLNTLTDDVIARSVAQFCKMNNRAVWLFELVGGAIEDRIEADDTCVGAVQRRAKFTAGALQQWVDRDEDAECIRGVEEWLNDVLAPVSVGGPFAAFLERGETRARCQGSFGEANFARLLEIKRNVDPRGMFRHTFGRGLVDFAALEKDS